MPVNQYASSWRSSVEIPTNLLNIARSAARSSLLSLLSTIRNGGSGPFLRGLYCHYVFDDQREQFENLIVELKKLGTFIDTKTCLDMLSGKVEIDGGYFHLSFDDGFRNIYTNAFPILKKHNVPAVHFVPSGMMDADWSQAAEYCLDVTRYRAVIEMCRWSDLKEMAAAGIEIGSHSRTHANLAAIAADTPRIEDEIINSKREIEERLGIECRYFAWPYGQKTDTNPLVLDMVRKAGYHACFGAYRGSIAPGTTDIMSIPRHLFEAQWPSSHVTFFASGKADFLYTSK